MTSGGCICGAVRFTVTGPMAQPVACHCTQCRKRSGSFSVATSAAREDVTVIGPLTWYSYKPGAEYAFCPTCGCQLLFRIAGDPNISIEMGALDGATGLRLAGHIFVAEKGDYYDLTDGLPQEPRNSTRFDGDPA